MATDNPPSNTSTLADEKLAEVTDNAPYDNGNKRHSLERIGSQNKSTEANIYPEREGNADADLEKTGEAPAHVPQKGGINPADFPDGGLEAWLVVFGGWCTLFVCKAYCSPYWKPKFLTCV
jgi:hypothetical protein